MALFSACGRAFSAANFPRLPIKRIDMKPPLLDIAWLNGRETVTESELSRVCAMSSSELDELVDYGALAPMNTAQPERIFSAKCVMPLRTASQLRHDFVLDLFTVAMLLGYLSRIESLERQLRSLPRALPCRLSQAPGPPTNI
jgi:chaperone modulatory protein CbpM